MSHEREERAEEGQFVWVTPQRRRRPRRRRHVYTKPINRHRALISLAALFLIVSGGVLYALRTTARYAVWLNSKPLVVLDSREGAERAVQDIKQAVAPDAPETVYFVEGEVTTGPYLGKMRSTDFSKAVTELDRRLTASVEGYTISVNGTQRVILATREATAEAIARMQQRGMAGRKGVPTFKERVRIYAKRYVEGEQADVPLVTAQQAAELLVRPPLPRIHTVKRGDNFWEISNANGITVPELKALNPGVDHTRLREGDKVRLPDLPSPVTVVVRK